MKPRLSNMLTAAVMYAPLLGLAVFFQDAVGLLGYAVLVGVGDRLRNEEKEKIHDVTDRRQRSRRRSGARTWRRGILTTPSRGWPSHS
jgi:hypothetical protein